MLCLLVACGEPAQERGAEPQPLGAEESPTMAPSRVVKLRVSEGEISRTYPVILTEGPDKSWSSAFRILCRDCTRALAAFGYTPQSLAFAATYDSEAALRADNQVDDTLPMLELPLDGAEPPILGAFRVVDAREGTPHYLVRLRAAPESLYEVTCASFLEVLQGSLATVPVSAPLVAHWQAAGSYPRIGCSGFEGKPLPPAAPAEPARTTLATSSLVEVWNVTRPLAGVRSSTYPYVISREASGELRGFAIDCGSEAFSALTALGLGPDSIRSTPPSDAELEATGFGRQPVLSCSGLGGAPILALSSSNDAANILRFQFGDQRDLVQFSCAGAEAYWSAQASRELELPYQALPHLSDRGTDTGGARVLTIGCDFDVLSFLQRIRGTKIVAGQHNREPNATPARFSARVAELAGKRPGLWSADFSFAAADVRDRPKLVEEGLAQWRAGSLVRLAFHACAPTVGSTCTFAHGEGIRGSLPDAAWRELLEDGTALNAAWKARLDEVAPLLAQLGDAGVQVIWSPLHLPNDSWGWWQGRPGPGGSRELYRLTHRYLTEVKRLDNLIWEWNVKDLGDPAGLSSYYPGDDVVDIVALSPWQAGFPTAPFYEAIRAIAGSKPIALAEVTKLPTETQLAAQPDWAYFSVWAENLTEQNASAEVRAAYALPRVLSQGQIPMPGARAARQRAEKLDTPPTARADDGPTAAARFGWGTPLPESDEFDVPGSPDPAKWDLPEGAGGCFRGHAGNGRRCAKNVAVVDGYLRLTGEASGDTGWIASKLDRQYGRIEARVRSANTSPSNGRQYHPLLIVWPSDDLWPEHGEYDFMENASPGEPCVEAFLHYPHPKGVPVQQERAREKSCGAPLSEWHNVAFEWTPSHVAGFVDGVEFFRYAGGAGPSGRGAIQSMPSGHLTIQLDNFYGGGMTPAVEEVAWVRFYPI